MSRDFNPITMTLSNVSTDNFQANIANLNKVELPKMATINTAIQNLQDPVLVSALGEVESQMINISVKNQNVLTDVKLTEGERVLEYGKTLSKANDAIATQFRNTDIYLGDAIQEVEAQLAENQVFEPNFAQSQLLQHFMELGKSKHLTKHAQNATSHKYFNYLQSQGVIEYSDIHKKSINKAHTPEAVSRLSELQQTAQLMKSLAGQYSNIDMNNGNNFNKLMQLQAKPTKRAK